MKVTKEDQYGIISQPSPSNEILSEMKVAMRYTLLTLFTLFTLFILFKLLYTDYTCKYAYIYY